MQTKNNLQFWT